jgi:hypothetical protein
LNSNHDFFMPLFAQTGEQTDFIDLKVALNRLLHRRNRKLKTLHDQDVGGTAEDPYATVASSDSPVAGVKNPSWNARALASSSW